MRSCAVEHDVRRLQVAVLHAHAVRVLERLAHLLDDARALRELERRPELAQLEAVDELHDEHGRRRSLAEFVDLHDARIGKQRQRAGLGEEVGEARGHAPVAAQHLRRHDPVELQVAQLVDLAHAAGAQSLDRAEALEQRQRRGRRVGRGARHAVRAFEEVRHAAILGDERAQRLDQVGPIVADRGRIERRPVQHVVLDPPLKPRLEVRVAHAGSRRVSVSAAIARASSIRHASSLRPIRAAISRKLSSSNLRSTITSRWSGVERLEREFEALGLFVDDGLAERGAHAGDERRGPGIVDRHGGRHVAALAVLEVGLVANLVLGNSRQPRHERRPVAALELVEVLERLQQRGLEDVARLEARCAGRAPCAAG